MINTFNPKDDIPANLRRLRKESGMKQKDVAEKTGIDNSTLSKFESGAREASWEDLKTLADFYGVSFAQVVGAEEPKELKEEVIDEETKRIMNLLNSLSDSERQTALAMLFGLEYKLRIEQSSRTRR